MTGLPAKTQEGLLQQALEKVARIKKVEVFIDLNEALVEFTSAAVSCFAWKSPLHESEDLECLLP